MYDNIRNLSMFPNLRTGTRHFYIPISTSTTYLCKVRTARAHPCHRQSASVRPAKQTFSAIIGYFQGPAAVLAL
jgi:hypothetical protein